MWVGCFDYRVFLYVEVRAWELDLSCTLVTVYSQPFWCCHYVISLCILVSFHVMKGQDYWSQLENLLMYVSIYWVIISDGIARVQGVAMVIDLLLLLRLDCYSRP